MQTDLIYNHMETILFVRFYIYTWKGGYEAIYCDWTAYHSHVQNVPCELLHSLILGRVNLYIKTYKLSEALPILKTFDNIKFIQNNSRAKG